MRLGTTAAQRPELTMLDREGAEVVRLHLYDDPATGGQGVDLRLSIGEETVTIGLDQYAGSIGFVSDDRFTGGLMTDGQGVQVRAERVSELSAVK